MLSYNCATHLLVCNRHRLLLFLLYKFVSHKLSEQKKITESGQSTIAIFGETQPLTVTEKSIDWIKMVSGSILHFDSYEASKG
jgi:hypothetical protein